MIDGHFLIFVEHQSTVNENMPLRLLFGRIFDPVGEADWSKAPTQLYIVQEYEQLIGYRIIKGKQVSNPILYNKTLIKLPKPEFFVLYNGKDDLKENGKVVTEKMMRLSDAFIEKNDSENSLELCVKLIDMRLPSHHESLYQENNKEVENNKEINGNLSLLGEYSYFINKIEELREQNDKLEDAIKKAMNYCIKHNILKEFLLKNETEVMTMLLGIYDEELEKQAIIEEMEERVREEEKAKQQALDTATELIKEGFQSEKILKCVKNLTLEDVINLQKKMNKE